MAMGRPHIFFALGAWRTKLSHQSAYTQLGPGRATPVESYQAFLDQYEGRSLLRIHKVHGAKEKWNESKTRKGRA